MTGWRARASTKNQRVFTNSDKHMYFTRTCTFLNDEAPQVCASVRRGAFEARRVRSISGRGSATPYVHWKERQKTKEGERERDSAQTTECTLLAHPHRIGKCTAQYRILFSVHPGKGRRNGHRNKTLTAEGLFYRRGIHAHTRARSRPPVPVPRPLCLQFLPLRKSHLSTPLHGATDKAVARLLGARPRGPKEYVY